MPLRCPRCSVDLEILEATPRGSDRRHRIEHCQRCGGLWLDQGELAEICPTLSGLRERHLEIQCLGSASTHVPRCPRCSRTPYTFRIVDLEVDCCVGCGGVWLDEAEQQGITRGLDPEDQQTSERRRRDPYRAMQRATQHGRVSCSRCSGTQWLSGTYMTSNGLICRRCFDAELSGLSTPAGFSQQNAEELAERFRPSSLLDELMQAIGALRS